MFRTRLFGLGMIVWLICGLASARAASMTYQFSGTLDQAYNGSNQFSGTFTYSTDLPLNPAVQLYPGWSYYTGVPTDPTEPVTSLSFQFGGTSSSSLGPVTQIEAIVAHTSGNDAFFIQEAFQGSSGKNYWAEIGMGNDNTVAHGPLSSTSLPASLSLSSFSMGADLSFSGNDSSGQYFNDAGRVTSMVQIVDGQPVPTPDPVPIPEPTSLLIFVTLAAGTCGLSRLRRRLRAA